MVLRGIKWATVRSPAIAWKTVFRVLSERAGEHTVPPLVPPLGTEKKYVVTGVEAMADIVAQGVVFGLSVSQPEVSEP